MPTPTSRYARRAIAALLLALALAAASANAAAAEWQLVGYLLPENGHPCMNDPYTGAGYAWIRKDDAGKTHRDQLRDAVKAKNAHASLAGPWPVRAERPVFLVAKQLQCRDYDLKTYPATSYEFIAAADEAALAQAMAGKQKQYPEIVGYTFEKIARPASELDAAGTATVVGRTE